MKHGIATIVLTVALVGIATIPVESQTSRKKSFDLISVKPTNARGIANRITTDGGRFNSPIATVWGLLRWAYRPPSGGTIFYTDDQIVGAPAWTQSDRFSVEAKVASGQVPVEDLRQMVQALLEDRFQLKIHEETRRLAVYELVVAKGGSKLKLSEDQTPPEPGQRVQRGFRGQRGSGPSTPVRGRTSIEAKPFPSGGYLVTMSGTGISIPVLIHRFQEVADRPIIDRTGLEGLFDIRLQFMLDAGPDGEPSDQDIFAAVLTALQEQAGLKLESSRGPSRVLVIDNVQRLTENWVRSRVED